MQLQEARNRAQVERLGTAKITKLMFEFAVPAIIGLVVTGLYSIIDSVFLGHGVGPIGLAAPTIAMPTMIVGMAVVILVGQGGNALTALRLGAGKRDEAEKVTGNTFTLSVIMSVVCTAFVFLFTDPILALSGATEETWDAARVFLRILSIGTILQFLGLGFNNFIRTAGDPIRAFLTLAAGTVVCIVFNYLFVMVFGWGVAGSAWATLIGQGVNAVLVMWYFVFSRKSPLKLRLKFLALRWPLIRSILSLGIAPFVLQAGMAFISVLVNQQLISLGAGTPIGSEGALAAVGVVGRIATFAFFPILGAAIAVQPLFGYNYGAKNYQRVKEIFAVGMVWVTVIGVLFWVLIRLFPEQVISVFGIKDELRDFAVTALKVQMFMTPLIGLQVVATQYFLASGQSFKAMFLSLTRQILYLLPLIYLLPMSIGFIIPTFTPLDGLYYAYPVADALSIITCAILMVFELRKLNTRIQEQQKQPDNQPKNQPANQPAK
jgi:putative MATE family efflux protein